MTKRFSRGDSSIIHLIKRIRSLGPVDLSQAEEILYAAMNVYAQTTHEQLSVESEEEMKEHLLSCVDEFFKLTDEGEDNPI